MLLVVGMSGALAVGSGDGDTVVDDAPP